MQRRRLRADEDAVSPVVGVILLVGIVVASMAIISTMVLGGTLEPAPNADVVYEDSGGEVTIVFTSAKGLTEANTDVRIDGERCDGTLEGSGPIDVGYTEQIDLSNCSGDTIQIVWTSGSRSVIIDSHERS